MNAVYLVLGCAVAALSLLAVAYRIGGWQRGTEDHLAAQDCELAELRRLVEELHQRKGEGC